MRMMKSTFAMVVGRMMMFSDVWAVYGIGAGNGGMGRDGVKTACTVSREMSVLNANES